MQTWGHQEFNDRYPNGYNRMYARNNAQRYIARARSLVQTYGVRGGVAVLGGGFGFLAERLVDHDPVRDAIVVDLSHYIQARFRRNARPDIRMLRSDARSARPDQISMIIGPVNWAVTDEMIDQSWTDDEVMDVHGCFEDASFLHIVAEPVFMRPHLAGTWVTVDQLEQQGEGKLSVPGTG